MSVLSDEDIIAFNQTIRALDSFNTSELVEMFDYFKQRIIDTENKTEILTTLVETLSEEEAQQIFDILTNFSSPVEILEYLIEETDKAAKLRPRVYVYLDEYINQIIANQSYEQLSYLGDTLRTLY